MHSRQNQKDDVQLYQGKNVQVADWKRSEKLTTALLIDDSLESSVATSGQFAGLHLVSEARTSP
jgi:hypothetical protein